ncbi:MAG: hypothetical protein V4436_02555 [Patescibacteria group bacterium]
MAKKGNDDKAKRRRSIMLPQSYIDEMAKVREAIGAQSDSEVIRRAFKLYKQLVNPNIGDIETTDKDGKKTKIIIT